MPKSWRRLAVRRRRNEHNGLVYCFVEVAYAGRRKKIAVHRLVWMIDRVVLRVSVAVVHVVSIRHHLAM